MQSQQHLPFIVRRISDKKIIGSTLYYDINAEHHRLAIGNTWYIPEAWSTDINPECKLVFLKFAFENSQVNRVQFIPDAHNSLSRAAIKKLVAMEESFLRQDMVLKNGYIRDSVVFSILKSDWPDV